jgi:K+-sensing histidine kinase KdpD
MNALDLAVIHDAKNSLSGLLLRLEKYGHFETEMQLIMRTSCRLTNLLLWHKDQEGEMRINIDSASPSDLVSELVSEYQQVFPELNIIQDVSTAPVFWFYDATYTRLALENAVHNACSFAKQTVHISASMKDGRLLFCVQDDGVGFSDEIVSNFAKEQYTEASCRGTGLGMLLSNSIAKSHQNKGLIGGVILRNNDGAVFEMYLP